MKFKFEKNQTVKKIYLISIVTLLMLPMIKEHIPLFHSLFSVRALNGYFPLIERPELSLANWWSGDFQNSQEEILKRDLKIRPLAYRINNQVHNSILREIRTNYVLGKDSYYFSKDYIEDYLGFRFVGNSKVKKQTEQLKYVSDKLKTNYDVEMIVALAPSKAYVLEDKLPPQYDLSQKTEGNYEAYLKALKELDIHVLDFNKYLTEQVKITGEKEHILMPKYGIHWSEYAGILAADSIANYIGLLKGKDVALINRDEIIKTTKKRNQDEDISESMNLLYPLKSQEYSYFDNFDRDTIGKYKPNIVLVGDSFAWTFWNKKLPHKLWGKESLLLYYYYTLWDPNGDSGKETQKEMLVPYAEKIDAFVILYTPTTMGGEWGNGFIERFYKILKKKEENASE